MKNNYEIRGELTAIMINSPKHGNQEAIISTSKLERADAFEGTWFACWDESSQKLYIRGNIWRNGKRTVESLHRWVTMAPKGTEVDHRNNSGLDNTDENLRVTTKYENQQNRKSATTKSRSGVRGVCWEKGAKKWRSYLSVNKKQINIGLFDDINEAEQAVKEARKQHMKFSNEAS